MVVWLYGGCIFFVVVVVVAVVRSWKKPGTEWYNLCSLLAVQICNHQHLLFIRTVKFE